MRSAAKIYSNCIRNYCAKGLPTNPEMEFAKPAKSALSLGKFTYDIQSTVRNKVTFTATPTNDASRNKYTESLKDDKFSSRGKFNQPIPNCIQNIKYVTRKPVISSQATAFIDVEGNALSHMPVYHKVLVSNHP